MKHSQFTELLNEITGFMYDSAGQTRPCNGWIQAGKTQVYLRSYVHPSLGPTVDVATLVSEPMRREPGLSLLILRHIERQAKRLQYRTVRIENVIHRSMVWWLENDGYQRERSYAHVPRMDDPTVLDVVCLTKDLHSQQ